MRRFSWSSMLLVPLLAIVPFVSRTGTIGRMQPQVKGTPRDLQRESRKANFQYARDLLLLKGVPFDPDLLLDSDWPAKLAPVCERMPEMQATRFEREPLDGLQLAGTLYLPERVELQGDTVILAKRVVFEGTNVVIKGEHSLHLLPAESLGVLGITARQLARREGVAPADLPSKPRLKPKGHITIDLHGAGYKEWLEKNGGEANVRGLVERVKRGDKAAMAIVIDQQGQPGGMGSFG